MEKMQLNPENWSSIGEIYVIKKENIDFENIFQFSSDRRAQY